MPINVKAPSWLAPWYQSTVPGTGRTVAETLGYTPAYGFNSAIARLKAADDKYYAEHPEQNRPSPRFYDPLPDTPITQFTYPEPGEDPRSPFKDEPELFRPSPTTLGESNRVPSNAGGLDIGEPGKKFARTGMLTPTSPSQVSEPFPTNQIPPATLPELPELGEFTGRRFGDEGFAGTSVPRSSALPPGSIPPTAQLPYERLKPLPTTDAGQDPLNLPGVRRTQAGFDHPFSIWSGIGSVDVSGSPAGVGNPLAQRSQSNFLGQRLGSVQSGLRDLEGTGSTQLATGQALQSGRSSELGRLNTFNRSNRLDRNALLERYRRINR